MYIVYYQFLMCYQIIKLSFTHVCSCLLNGNFLEIFQHKLIVLLCIWNEVIIMPIHFPNVY